MDVFEESYVPNSNAFGQRPHSGMRLATILTREKVRKAFLYMRPTANLWRVEDLGDSNDLYPISFEALLHNGHYTLKDESGLPVGMQGGFAVHNYTKLCSWALAHWAIYVRTRNTQNLDSFLLVVSYLLRTAERSNRGMTLRSEVAKQGHIGGWSAMGQGLAISVLVRAFAITGDEQFLRAAIDCLGLYQRSVDEGGVVSHELGRIWYEEYPTRPLLHVLNGMIFAMLGLWELAPVAPESGARSLWQQGVSSLEALVDQFDLGDWSAYGISDSSGPRIASMQYHLQHVALLDVLAQLTGLNVFGQFSARFAAYAQNPINRLRAGIGLVRVKMSDAKLES